LARFRGSEGGRGSSHPGHAALSAQGLSGRKTLQFPGILSAAQNAVCSADNACRKLFTGTIRSPWA
jgi:hypothetical protein